MPAPDRDHDRQLVVVRVRAARRRAQDGAPARRDLHLRRARAPGGQCRVDVDVGQGVRRERPAGGHDVHRPLRRQAAVHLRRGREEKEGRGAREDHGPGVGRRARARYWHVPIALNQGHQQAQQEAAERKEPRA